MHSFYSISNQNDFFDILPDDWRIDIAGIWDSYSKTSSIYLLESKQIIVAGGIVFSTCPPDMLYNKEEAQKWFDEGYLCIGYLWVPEEYRGKNFGSKWLQSLMKKHPSQKFWLTIEEESLTSFYEKNGFQLVKSLQKGNDKEWLLVDEPKSN